MSDIEGPKHEEEYVYPDQCSIEEQRRAFVLKWLADSEIYMVPADELIPNMEKLCEWLKTGKTPKKPRLEVVQKRNDPES